VHDRRNECARRSGGVGEPVSGIMWGNPEGSTTGSCIYVYNVSGFEIKENWFDCNIGVTAVNSNIGSITRNTFDGSNNQGIILKGNGASSDNPSHSLIVAENQFYAQRWYCMQLDGIGGATIENNNLDYCKQYGIWVNSPEAYTTYNVKVLNNNFLTSTGAGYYTSDQQHIVVQTPLVDSQISGNTFQLSRAGDVTVANAATANLTLSDNTFKNGQAGSLTVSAAGAGLKVLKNSWISPGGYAGQFSAPALLQGNYCTNPFAVTGLPPNDYDKGCFQIVGSGAANSKANDNVTDSNAVAALAIHASAFPSYTSGNRSSWATADVYVYTNAGPAASANERAVNGAAPFGAVFTTNVDPSSENANFAGDLTMRDIPGVEYLVSKYSSLQAAINAAYNNGSVLGTVIDDRMAPYVGPGFTVPDSVVLKLAATTYTINGTVTFNNGNNNVTAGIVMQPGARMMGTSTSTNHGTIIAAGNGLNADLIATSSVGTGIGAGAQWWHWGGLENLRIMGNGANQTAGNCLNIENMGETAFLRDIEVSGCYLDNILFSGASATPSDMANITTNSAGRYGFNFNNLAGIAVVHGLSGDSNTTSLVRLNGGQSGTLTILGFKTEEEISGQDPLITIDETGQNGAQPSLFVVGGYTFGRSGVNDVIKYVNGTVGTTPYISVSNFYVQNYVNAVNDVVNGRTTAAANMNKVPFYYGPNGAFYSGQAFTLDLNTFVQSPHSGNGVLTEILGTTSSNETMVAASGTSSNIGTGGIGFRMPNRTTYGQMPEQMAKMTFAFPGGVSNNQEWEFIPTKATGDSSTRWIGDPSFRWDEMYAADVNSTTATIGTLNVTTCNGCGTGGGGATWGSIGGTLSNQTDLTTALNAKANSASLATVATSGSYNDLSNKPAIPSQGMHLVSGTLLGTSGAITGNGSDQNVFSVSLPAGTFAVGAGVKCYARFGHSGTTSVTHKWMLGSTMIATQTESSSKQNQMAEIEIFTPTSLTSQLNNVGPLVAANSLAAGPQVGLTSSENLGSADTLKFTFNVASSDTLTPKSFYCTTIQ
jgi:hypothetical protein